MKVLEYVYKNNLKPIGGPNGYVYNIMNSFCDNNVIIETLPEKIVRTNGLRKHIPVGVTNFLRVFKENKRIKQLKKGLGLIPNIENYDIIHFHSALDLIECSNQLSRYNGKIILTIHSPIPPHLEIYQDFYSPIMRAMGGKRRMKNYKYMIEKAFDLCDIIVYPCKEAEDSYYELWDGYDQLMKRNNSKVVYLPTGCVQKTPALEKENILSNIVPQNRFVICYAGRHNLSKGYDILKEICYELNKSIQYDIVVCGKIGPLYPPKISNWHEIGWTKEADSYINASDVFILPNRWTFFDLVFLEALSMGKIIVASKTGGNKYFSRFPKSGIFLYDSVQDACEIIKHINLMSKEERTQLEQINKEIYNNNFTSSDFSNRYRKLYVDAYNNKLEREYF